MEKYHPDEQDKDAYLLQSAHVNEGEYFSPRVYEDIDSITADIKQAGGLTAPVPRMPQLHRKSSRI